MERLYKEVCFHICFEGSKRRHLMKWQKFRSTVLFLIFQVEETKHIAEVRIHIEHLIGRIKCYHILDGSLPLSRHYLAEDIILTCACLTLFPVSYTHLTLPTRRTV